MRGAEGGGVDGAVAHHLFDDGGAQPVVRAERDATVDRQAALGDRSGPGAGLGIAWTRPRGVREMAVVPRPSSVSAVSVV